jgi:sulfide:quinone oxidoreductase
MDNNRSVMPCVEPSPDRPESQRARAETACEDELTQAEPPAIGVQRSDRKAHTQPLDRVKRSAEPADLFSSVLCGVDRSVNSLAAHQQAALFAAPGGGLEVVPSPRLTRQGDRALHDACEGHDLVALGAGGGASAVVEHAPIPVLLGRWSAPGTEVTDRILVAVDDSDESRRALELAGRLTAVHGGSVTVLVAPQRDPALQRAIAASRRIVLQTTGALPTVLGEQLPRDRAIPATAVAINASLVVLGTGDNENARRTTAQIASRIEASVLAVPPAAATAGRHVPGDSPYAMAPDAPSAGPGINPSPKQVHEPDTGRGPAGTVSQQDDGNPHSHHSVSPRAERATHKAHERRAERVDEADRGRRGRAARSGRRGGPVAKDKAMSAPSRPASRPRVVIAGGGVAGLETLLALRALAADRVDVTLLAPELKFVNRSMAVDQPFKPQRVRGLRLADTAAELDARWYHGALDRVEHDQRRIITKDGRSLRYDMLVIAIGARPEREWHSDAVLTYHDGRDGPDYRLLLHQLREGHLNGVAFVKPAGPSWPLPLYDLALLTAADCAAHERSEVDLSLITPEEQPLAIFGSSASAAIRGLLAGCGVTLHTSSYGNPGRPGWLDITPGDHAVRVDRVVTEPRLVGPRLRGIPSGRDGFIHTDAHGRLAGLDGVFAAGDATAFPVKQGGLAAQQADAVAEAIAASVGADIEPQPFRPILRGVLLTGGPARYLRADISGGAGDDSTISGEALWWPPDKIAGRYLAPYLSRQVGDAADVMPAREHAIPVESRLDAMAPDTQPPVDELSDLRLR